MMSKKLKVKSIEELYEVLPNVEWVILDILRGIILDKLPEYCKEKISYNVPYFYGNKGISILWPASIPRGGVTEGVLLGFRQGNLLEDPRNYLTRGTNKKVYYKIYNSPDEIDIKAVQELLDEAIQIDMQFK